MTKTLVYILFTIILYSTGVAYAQTARDHFRRGAEAYKQGHYEEAITEWQKAYELDPKPLLQYNLSQAYERLAQIEKAIQAIESYIKHAPAGDRNMGDARARLASLHQRLSNTSISILGGEEGATILIDGEDWGRTPRHDPIRVNPGVHEVEIAKQGYKTFNSTVVVPAGQRIDLPVSMQAEKAGEPALASGTEAVAEPSDQTGEDEAESGTGSSILPWVLIGAGGVAVITGSILGISALSEANDAETSESDEADSARGLALGADILFGVGIVAAAAGVALLVLFPNEEPEPTGQQVVRFAPQLTVDTVGLHALGRF